MNIKNIILVPFFMILILFVSGRYNFTTASKSPAADVFTDIDANLFGGYGTSAAWGDYDKDGNLDIIVSGWDTAKIFRNDGTSFTDINAGITGARKGSVSWGDYDNDNDLDILLTGENSSGSVTKIYRNDSGNFTEVNTNLPGVDDGAAAWGDYDHDGDLDIAITGTSTYWITKIFRNDNGVYVDINASLQSVTRSSVAWGDYDNDGDLDLAVGGHSYVKGTDIYRNDNGSFVKLNANLLQIKDGSVEWGDCDNDGDFDLLINSYTNTVPPGILLYENNNGAFIQHFIGVSGTTYGNAALGDYDNDGDLDIVILGYPYPIKVYRNDNNFVFTDTSALQENINNGNARWGDFNNDGKLDFLASGNNTYDYKTWIFQNNSDITSNTAPTAPTELNAQTEENHAILSWNVGTDAETPSASLTYNLRIGTSPGGTDVVSSMSDTQNGFRYVPQIGNMGHKTQITIEGLSPGKIYYWSVQSIDSAFAGSSFANEQSFITTQIVDLVCPDNGFINTSYPITATTYFSDPITSITYTWETTDQSTIIRTSNEVVDTVSYSWEFPGTKSVKITASNGKDILSQMHNISIKKSIYLPLAGKPLPPFYDDFSNPDSGWSTGDYGHVLYQYLDGEFQVLLKSASHAAYVTPTRYAPFNISISVDARRVGNWGDFGIMFGLDPSDPYAFYAFIIETNSLTGYYSLIKHTNGDYTSLIDWTLSPAINHGAETNRLNIVWQNDGTIMLYINDVFLESYQGETPFTDQREFGFYTRSYENENIDIRFDNFSMFQP